MPETGAYLILGLAATFIIMGFFITSMIVRHRNLQKYMQVLEQLGEDDQ